MDAKQHMGVRKNHPLAGGDDGFWVTEAGKLAVLENSPAPPKLTRSQQTYRDWLRYDSDMPFIEYAKMKSRQRAMEAGR